MVNQYEIGGVCVEMTAAQAGRWNTGDTTCSDLRRIAVHVPIVGNDCRTITLRRATNSRLEPVIAAAIENQVANLVR